MFNLIESTNNVFDQKFVAYAELMNRLQQEHDVHKHTALKIRMEMIGKSEEQKRLYSRGSDEFKYIQEGYKANGWTQDIIDNAWSAWCKYKELKGNANPEFHQLAEKASVSQLMVLNRAEDNTITYDAAMALKRTGKVPSVSKLRGHLGGYTDSKFENTRPTTANQTKPFTTTTKPYVAPPQPTEEERRQYSEMKRLGVDAQGYEHLQSLTKNENLPLINDVETAKVWNGGNIDAALDVIEQSLMIKGGRGCATELRLREILDNHMKRCREEEMKRPGQTVELNNQIVNGIRMRR